MNNTRTHEQVKLYEREALTSYFEHKTKTVNQILEKTLEYIKTLKEDYKIHAKLIEGLNFAMCDRNYKKALNCLSQIQPAKLSNDLKFKLHLYEAYAYRENDNFIAARQSIRSALNAYQQIIEPVDYFFLWLIFYWGGTILLHLRKYNRALRAFQASLNYASQYTAEKDAPTLLGHTYNCLGWVYFSKGQYHTAEEYFKKALKEDPQSPLYFNNLGNYYLATSHFRLEEYNLGMADLHLARAAESKNEGFPKALALYNLGLLLFQAGLISQHDKKEKEFYQNSIEHFAKAGKIFYEKFKKPLHALSAEIMIHLVNQRIIELEGSHTEPNFNFVAKRISEGLFGEVENYVTDTVTQHAMEEFLFRERTINKKDCFFSILRRWNSYTPRVPFLEDEKGRGGGYFLVWRGQGIVIDPGFDFITNFNESGYSLEDIDAIVVTHNHMDHTADLEAIMMLLYERNKKVIVGETTGKQIKKIDLFLDPNSWQKYKYFGEISISVGNKRVEKAVTNKIYKLDFIEGAEPDKKLHRISTEKKFIIKNIDFEAFPTTHISGSIGIKLYLNNPKNTKIIGITSDTKYSRCLPEWYAFCDILAIHVGYTDFGELALSSEFCIANKEKSEWYLNTVKDSDISSTINLCSELPKRNDKTKKRERKHLGLSGTFKLIDGLRKIKSTQNRPSLPSLIILTEFGEEMNMYRYRFSKAFNEYMLAANEKNCYVFTGDIGLLVNLGKKDLYSLKCNNCSNWSSLDKINEICLRQENKAMKYFCSDCETKARKKDSSNPWAYSDETPTTDKLSFISTLL